MSCNCIFGYIGHIDHDLVLRGLKTDQLIIIIDTPADPFGKEPIEFKNPLLYLPEMEVLDSVPVPRRLQRRKVERLKKRLDKMEATKLERLRKTPEYHHAKKAIEAFYDKEKAKANEGSPKP